MRHFFSSPRCNIFLAVIVLLFLQYSGICDCFQAKPYRFFRLFSTEALTLLTTPGGAAVYASQFLRHFYLYPWAGPCIAAGIFYAMSEGLAILSRRRWPLVSVSGGLLAVVLETLPNYPTEYTLSTLAAVWLTVVYLRSGRVWAARLPRPWNLWQHILRAVPYLALFLWLVGFGSGTDGYVFYRSTLSVFYDEALSVPTLAALLPAFYLIALGMVLSRRWNVWENVDDWLARGRRWRGFSLRRLTVDVLQILVAFALGFGFYVQAHLGVAALH